MCYIFVHSVVFTILYDIRLTFAFAKKEKNANFITLLKTVKYFLRQENAKKEELAQEYKDYFKRYGYTREEAQHVENMVQKYGVEYILKPVN